MRETEKATRTPFAVKQRKDNLRMLYNDVVWSSCFTAKQGDLWGVSITGKKNFPFGFSEYDNTGEHAILAPCCSQSKKQYTCTPEI